jgi:phosphoribosylformylglycinamidine cyclo-ligase
MMLVVKADQAEALTKLLREAGEKVVTMGKVVPGEGVIYKGRLL